MKILKVLLNLSIILFFIGGYLLICIYGNWFVIIFNGILFFKLFRDLSRANFDFFEMISGFPASVTGGYHSIIEIFKRNKT